MTETLSSPSLSLHPTSSSPLDGAPPPFDITKTYRDLLRKDPLLTMPVAAIEALILLLSHSLPSTISETLSLLSHHSAILKRSVRNPIPLSAGTDLFQRYLISTLQSSSSVAVGYRSKGGVGRSGGGNDFKSIRAHLMSNGRLFVKRAKEARGKIAGVARMFVRDGCTVLTSGGSRVVGAALTAAVEEGVRFRVIYTRYSNPSMPRQEHAQERQEQDSSLVQNLRAKGVPVAEISEGAVAYAMGKVDMVLVGAEGVVENGGVINRMGTYQMALLARSASKPFYVVAESHKFVRLYPLGQYDLPIEQKVLDFRTGKDVDDAEKESKRRNNNNNNNDGGGGDAWGGDADVVDIEESGLSDDNEGAAAAKRFPPARRTNRRNQELVVVSGQDDAVAVDFTPPDLITALITESGVHTPSAVSEELIKIWY